METYERIADAPLSPDFEALSTLFKCATLGNIHGQDEAYLKLHAAISQRDSLLSVQKQLVEALEELRWVGNDLRERKAARAKADAAILAAKASS